MILIHTMVRHTMVLVTIFSGTSTGGIETFMEAFKENILTEHLNFPVDIFIQDNLKSCISVDPHWHDCIEILYMLEGTALQEINHQDFMMKKNDLIVLNEGDIHATHCKYGEDSKILVIKFHPNVLSFSYQNAFESRYLVPFLNSRSGNVTHLQNASHMEQVDHILMGLYYEFTQKKMGYEIYIKGCIYQMIALFIRMGILNIYTQDIKEKQFEPLNKLLKYIEDHYSEEIDLQTASGITNLSYYHLSRVFKKITGRNFKAYVDYVRVCEAEKRIMFQNVNISRAALDVGFSNVSSFNRVYKRIRNYPPSSLKKSKNCKE